MTPMDAAPSRRQLLRCGLAAACLARPTLACAQSDPSPKPLELNTASRAQLESLRGLGPTLVERLLQARQQQAFEGWADLRQRVRGIGPALARQLSEQGLRVAGQAWQDREPAASASGP